jgi:hypothetical protein
VAITIPLSSAPNAVQIQVDDALQHAGSVSIPRTELVEEFITAYHAEVNAKAATVSAERDAAEHQLVRVKKQIETIIDSIADGFRTEGMKGRLEDLENRRVSLERQIAQPRPTTVRIHPALPEPVQGESPALGGFVERSRRPRRGDHAPAGADRVSHGHADEGWMGGRSKRRDWPDDQSRLDALFW